MKLPQKFTFAGMAATLLIATSGRLVAADLSWNSGATIAQVTHNEPIGGRIDDTGDEGYAEQAVAAEAPGGGGRADDAWSQPRSRPLHGRTAQQPLRQPMRPASMPRGGAWQGQPAPRMSGYQPSPPSHYEMRGAPRARITGPVAFAPQPEPEAVDTGEVIDSNGGEYIEGMPGEIIEGDIIDEGFAGGFEGGCGDACGDCEDDCCLLSCDKCPPGCIPAPQWPKNIDILGGVQGFKGPLDQGRNGNFGFHEGFNVGGPLWLARCVSYQFGGTWVQSNLSGDSTNGAFRDETRHQTFATAGLFWRADSCWPWQGGVVLDWLHDDYVVDYNISQVRAELSRVGCFGTELGFMGAFNIREEEIDDVNGNGSNLPIRNGVLTLRTVDQYALFLRRQFDNCGEGRVWGGVSGEGQGLVGADFRVPVSESFLIQGNFNYLAPKEGGHDGQREESWGLTLDLVFQPFCRARRGMTDHNRPLFNVADNSRLFVEPKD